MNEDKNAIAPGNYDAEIVNVLRATSNGKDAHFILNIGVRPTTEECARQATDNVATYFADLPLVMTVGQEYRFWNNATKKPEMRKCVATDTDDAISWARKCFPEWAQYVDSLPEGTAPTVALKWFETAIGKTCRASFKAPDFRGDKTYYNARLLPIGKTLIEDGFNAAFLNALKASGVKFGKVKKVTTASVGTASAGKEATMPTPPPSPSVPPAPSAPSNTPSGGDTLGGYTLDAKGAFSCYATFYAKSDPNANKFWERVAYFAGKDAAEQATFTKDDWRKVIKGFYPEAM